MSEIIVVVKKAATEKLPPCNRTPASMACYIYVPYSSFVFIILLTTLLLVPAQGSTCLVFGNTCFKEVLFFLQV